MNNTAVALLGYAGWTLFLILTVEVVRIYLVAEKGYPATSFKPDGADVSPLMNRLCRAHANCVENFPIIGGILVLALATEHVEITDSLALYLLGARACQSVSHIWSGQVLATNIRFVFYAIQLAIAVSWVVGFVQIVEV